MKKLNIFLLMKQGIKGVFKYKIQFALIVILGFFASLILSITFSINNRLNFEYNRTMGHTQRFDYLETRTLETSTQSTSKKFVPFNDFIPDQYLEVDGKSVAYNFNISSFENNDEYNETFLTETFASQEFKDIFENLILSDFTDSWFKYEIEQGPYFNAYGMDVKQTNRDETNYWYRFDDKNEYNEDYFKSPYLVYTTSNNGWSEFTIQTTQLIKDNIKKSNLLNESSLICILLNKSKNEGIDQETFFESIETYLNYSITSILAQLNKMMHDYVQYWMDLAINQSEVEWKIYFEENSHLSETEDIKNAEVMYEWLFGKKLNSTINLDLDNFLVSDENEPWDQKILTNEENNILLDSQNIYTYGARGSLVQLIKIEDQIVVSDDGSALTLLQQQSNLDRTLRFKEAYTFKDDYKDENASLPTTYLWRFNLLSEASNVDVYPRLEVNLPDNTEEKEYRFVLMDERTKNNLTVYQGQMPRNQNEVLINPQYAKENKIEIGQNIRIGNFDLTVSGYAADPYTNFPLANLTVPFPNNKKGAIVFISPEALKNVLDSSDTKISTTTLYTILTSKNKQNLESNISLYNSLNFAYTDTISQDFENIKNGGNSPPIEYNSKLIDYNSHPFSWNWELTPEVLTIFSIVSYTTCAVILLICLITIIISVRKTINFNSGEIGILKALGAKNQQIAFGYISYGLVLLLIVIPISWFIGGFLQDLFSGLFISYMGGAYSQLWFNGESLAILLFAFGLMVIVVSYLTAFILINKPVLMIIEKKEVIKRIEWIDNLKFKLTKNSNFSTRFSLELAISGLKPTLIAGITILIASLLVSSSMAIPGMVNKAVTSYYENVKYANSLKNVEPIGNAPMSKTSLSPWNGPDYYEQYLVDINNEFEGINYLSTSVTDTTGITDFSMIPKLILNEDSNHEITADWLLNVITGSNSDLNEEENATLLSIIFSVFGAGLPQTLGKGINIAEIQRLIEFMAHDYRRDPNADMEKFKNDIHSITGLLTEGLPPILQQLFPIDAVGGGINNDSWKENIINIILSQTPSYVKNFLNKSENRFNQYSFGWTYSNYIPESDDFYTLADFDTVQGQKSQLLGLQSNQKAYKLAEGGDKIFIDDESMKEVRSLLIDKDQSVNSIVTSSGFELYNNNTLNIPVAINEQAKFKLNQKKGNIEINDFQSTRLVLSSDQKILPNGAWIYDDRDWATLNNKDTSKYFLNPFDLEVSKFTFAKVFDIENYDYDYNWNYSNANLGLTDNSYGFIDIDTDKNDNLVTEIRPYYQYENLLLFLPKKYENDFSSVFKLGSNNPNSLWHGSTNSAPDEVVKAWDAQPNDEFIWIRPYSLRFDSRFTPAVDNLSGTELDWLFNEYESFYKNNFLQAKPPIVDKYTDMGWKENGLKKINLVPVSKLDVYGKNLIIADQRLTNLLHGFSDEKYIPFNYVYEKSQKGSYLLNNQEILLYEYNKPEDLIALNNKENWIWGNEVQKQIQPLMWSNGIFSQELEPLFLTTQASFSKSVRVGEHSLNGDSQYFDGLEMESVEFLTEQKALINQIAALILTIGITFIVVIIIVATLSMIIITDLYVNQYKHFMIVMKSLGYSNWKIIYYSFGLLTLLSIISLTLGILSSFILVWATTSFVQNNFLSIPIGLTWWVPLIAGLLIIASYTTSILITTRKIRTEAPVSLIV